MPDPMREAWSRLRRRRWIRFAAAGLALALAGNLVFAFVSGKTAVWSALGRVSLGWLALAVALALVPWFTNAARLWIWARFAGGTLRGADAFQISVASDLGAAFTPTAAGSGTVRFALLVGGGLSVGRTSAVLVWMGLEDALFFLFFVPASYGLASRGGSPLLRDLLSRTLPRAAALLLGALALGALLTAVWKVTRGRAHDGASRSTRGGVLGRVRTWWGEMRAVLAEVLRRGKLRAAASFGITTVQWICRYSAITAILTAFGLPVVPVAQIALQWAVLTAGTLVPTPGGATAVETAFAVLYRPFVPAELLGTVTALWRFILFYLVILLDALVLAVFLLRDRRPVQRGGKTEKRRPASTLAENEVSSAPCT